MEILGNSVKNTNLLWIVCSLLLSQNTNILSLSTSKGMNNVALHKPVASNFLHSNSVPMWYNSSLTVDGYINTCTKTNTSHALWSVDLGKAVEVSLVAISTGKFSGSSNTGPPPLLFVHGYDLMSRQRCTNMDYLIAENYTTVMPCVFKSRYVEIAISHSYDSLELCEIEIYACRNETYGHLCAHRCPETCNDCNRTTCPSGCKLNCIAYVSALRSGNGIIIVVVVPVVLVFVCCIGVLLLLRNRFSGLLSSNATRYDASNFINTSMDWDMESMNGKLANHKYSIKITISPTGGLYVIPSVKIEVFVPAKSLKHWNEANYGGFPITITRTNIDVDNFTSASDTYEFLPHQLQFRKHMLVKFPLKLQHHYNVNSIQLLYSDTDKSESPKWVMLNNLEKSKCSSFLWLFWDKFCYVYMDHFCKIKAVLTPESVETRMVCLSALLFANYNLAHKQLQFTVTFLCDNDETRSKLRQIQKQLGTQVEEQPILIYENGGQLEVKVHLTNSESWEIQFFHQVDISPDVLFNLCDLPILPKLRFYLLNKEASIDLSGMIKVEMKQQNVAHTCSTFLLPLIKLPIPNLGAEATTEKEASVSVTSLDLELGNTYHDTSLKPPFIARDNKTTKSNKPIQSECKIAVEHEEAFNPLTSEENAECDVETIQGAEAAVNNFTATHFLQGLSFNGRDVRFHCPSSNMDSQISETNLQGSYTMDIFRAMLPLTALLNANKSKLMDIAKSLAMHCCEGMDGQMFVFAWFMKHRCQLDRTERNSKQIWLDLSAVFDKYGFPEASNQVMDILGRIKNDL